MMPWEEPSWTESSETGDRVLSLVSERSVVASLSEMVVDIESSVDEMTAGTVCSGTDLVSCVETGNEVVCLKERAAVSSLASPPRAFLRETGMGLTCSFAKQKKVH